jgi:ribosomal protein L7/L12
MENLSEDLGEQIIFQLRELIKLLEIKFGQRDVSCVENGSK